MWKKKFVYVLNYLKTFKAVHKNNPQTHPPHQNKKNCIDDSCIFQSLYSPKVAGTIIALRLPSFTKNCVSGIKQKKWTPPLNSAYIHISLGTKFQLKLTILFFYFFIFFGSNLPTKRVFPVKNRKSEDYHWFLHILISIGTEFQLNAAFHTQGRGN